MTFKFVQIILSYYRQIKYGIWFSLVVNYTKIYFRNLFNKIGNKIKFVNNAINNVSEVSQPKAKVPPKLVPQKTMKPATKTKEV